jgi:hypothetical protein
MTNTTIHIVSRSLTCINTSPPPNSRHLIGRAGRLHTLGLNLVAQRSKKPLAAWKSDPDWTTTRQTVADVTRLNWHKANQIALVCGAVSGDLVCMDFDRRDLPYVDKQPDRAALDTFLAGLGLPLDYPWCEQTPRGGWHVWLICHDLTAPDDHKGGKVDRAGLESGHIELRYEGVLTTLYFESLPDGPPATVNAGQLLRAYELVTVAPEIKLTHVDPSRRSDAPAHYADLYESYCREVEAAAIRTWKIMPANGDGWSRSNFSSPLREDRNPSARWSFNAHGFKDFATGEFYNTATCADLLSLPTWDDYKRQNQPEITKYNTNCRFPIGLPSTLSHRLRNVHLKVHVKSQHPADLVWAVWQELGNILPDDQPFTAGQYKAATERIGRNLTRDTIQTGLDQLAVWGSVEFCDNCNLATQGDTSSRLQMSQKSGRPGQLYHFLPIDQQVTHFDQHYRYILREKAFAGVPSEVQPEYGDLSEDDLLRLDDLRAPVYAEHEKDRQKSQADLDRGVGMLESAIGRIQQGRYIPVTLPPGELPNTRVYRRALQKMEVPADGTAKEEAYKDMFKVGCSRSTLARIRAVNQVITVAREKVIPLDQVTDYQRDNGLVLAEHDDGTATIRAPSAEKFADLADEHERAAYETLCQRQRETRSRATSHESQFESTPRPKSGTIPATYSDRHILEQFEFTPGADQIRRYDAETGEVYTPGELWQHLAGELTAPVEVVEVSEGTNLPTFSVFSEPPAPEAERETEDRQSPACPICGATMRQTRRGATLNKRGPAYVCPVAEYERQKDDRGNIVMTGSHPFVAVYEADRLTALPTENEVILEGVKNMPDEQRHLTASELRALAGVTAEEAAQHVCECCGKPAIVLHLCGWLCGECYDLSLVEKMRRWRISRVTIEGPVWAESEAAR